MLVHTVKEMKQKQKLQWAYHISKASSLVLFLTKEDVNPFILTFQLIKLCVMFRLTTGVHIIQYTEAPTDYQTKKSVIDSFKWFLNESHENS